MTFVKWALRLVFFAVWAIRVGYLHILIREKSLFMVTAYLCEFAMLLHQLIALFKENSICAYFANLQIQLNSSRVKGGQYQRSIKLLNILSFVLAVFLFIDMSDYTVRVVRVYGGIFVQLDFLVVFHQLLINNCVLASCSLYALALIGHFIKVDIELKRFKCFSISGSNLCYSELLKMVQRLEDFHSVFEETFSFMPFTWISYNWCQATIYLIGVTFGPLKSIFDVSLFVWSSSLQVATFITIALAISVQNRVAYECHKVQIILEHRLNESNLNSASMVYLVNKLDKISDAPFSSWNFCHLHKSLVFNYLASLISFSVLTLQMDIEPAKAQS